MTTDDVRAGSLTDLQKAGRLLTKVGALPVVVFWDDGAAYAIEDRCPHLGFPGAPKKVAECKLAAERPSRGAASASAAMPTSVSCRAAGRRSRGGVAQLVRATDP